MSKWECGRGCPDISLINKLAEIFGLGTEALLEGEINNESTDGGNMKNGILPLSEVCGNVISATDAAEMICCSRKLEALKLRSADEEHKLKAEKTGGISTSPLGTPWRRSIVCALRHMSASTACIL